MKKQIEYSKDPLVNAFIERFDKFEINNYSANGYLKLIIEVSEYYSYSIKLKSNGSVKVCYNSYNNNYYNFTEEGIIEKYSPTCHVDERHNWLFKSFRSEPIYFDKHCLTTEQLTELISYYDNLSYLEKERTKKEKILLGKIGLTKEEFIELIKITNN